MARKQTATWMALTLAAAFAAAPAAAEEASAPQVKAGGQAVFLTFLNAPLSGAPILHSPKLSLTINGGRTVRAVMDTGSTGAVVAARLIPNVESLPVLGRGAITYTSSGRIMRGKWVRVPLTIAGTNGGEVTTEPMPVLAVERVDCAPNARNCKTLTRPLSIAMLGIGFARQRAVSGTAAAATATDSLAWQQGARGRNPLLNLTGMGTADAPGPMRQAYMITRRGVWLGLTPDMLEGFSFLKLPMVDAVRDWGPIPACLSIDGRQPPACGTALIDTGVTTMFLSLPPAQTAERTRSQAGARVSLAPGTELKVSFGPPGSPLGYGFRTGDAGNRSAPGAIIVNSRADRVFVNTSVRLLNAYDYLYDAQEGFVGFRPVQ